MWDGDVVAADAEMGARVVRIGIILRGAKIDD